MRPQSSAPNVAETALDAARCKLSAVQLGYYKDDFLQYFVTGSARRIPLIHVGYYLRYIAIENAVEAFLTKASSEQVQIISLGAGFDTLFFRLLHRHSELSMHFVEVDSSVIISKKKNIVATAKNFEVLFKNEGEIVESTSSVSFQCHMKRLHCSYTLLEADLGDLAQIENAFSQLGLSPARPTLIVMECVLSYLPFERGTELLAWLSDWFTGNAALIAYDPISLNDSFSDTLQKYFKTKGCELRSMVQTGIPSQHQASRFLLSAGWKQFRMFDMNSIWKGCSERDLLLSLEPFDEYADLAITNAHYAITIVSNAPFEDGRNSAGANMIDMFCGLQQQVGVRADLFTFPAIMIRTIECSKRELETARELYKSAIFDDDAPKGKAVKVFLAKQLQNEMADIENTFVHLKSRAHFWVAVTEDKVIGSLGLKPDDNEKREEANLVGLRVDRAYQRRGIASRLVEIGESFAEERGYKVISLKTTDAMVAADKFYKSKGYRVAQTESFAKFNLLHFSKNLI